MSVLICYFTTFFDDAIVIFEDKFTFLCVIVIFYLYNLQLPFSANLIPLQPVFTSQ